MTLTPVLTQVGDKATRQLLQQAERQGFQISRTRNGHFCIRRPDGDYATTAAGTPSDHRSIRNLKAALKRHGFFDPREMN